jgi:uncharacterized protein (TIGR03435 family)
MRFVACCLLFTVAVLAGAVAQGRSTFDVVSVKTFVADGSRRVGNEISVLPGGRFSAPSATLRGLITAAYGVLDIQVVDSGKVLGNGRFEIEGRTRPDVTIAEARSMLQSVLVERFGLVTHRETRELPVYVMALARDDRTPGPNLRPSGPECALPKGPTGVPPPPPPPGGPIVGRVLALNGFASRCGSLFFDSTAGAHWSLRETTLQVVAERLIQFLGRPVIDRTGLTGNFDLDLSYTPDNPVVDASNAPNAPSLVTALREQLGLRLEPSKAPVEVLVVDRVRPPIEN